MFVIMVLVYRMFEASVGDDDVDGRVLEVVMKALLKDASLPTIDNARTKLNELMLSSLTTDFNNAVLMT